MIKHDLILIIYEFLLGSDFVSEILTKVASAAHSHGSFHTFHILSTFPQWDYFLRKEPYDN